MPGLVSDSILARELISIGDEAIATEDDAKGTYSRLCVGKAMQQGSATQVAGKLRLCRPGLARSSRPYPTFRKRHGACCR